MYEDDTGRLNSSGCPDPTYRDAARSAAREGRENMRRCIRVMLAVATAMGCNVLNRIELQDRKSGEVSR